MNIGTPPPDLQRYAWLSIATSILTLGLKFGAFALSNSISLLSDAIESLVNLSAGVIALWALWLAGLPADRNHAFGHHKAEYFSSAAEGSLILLAAASIVWAALERFSNPAALAQLGGGLAVSFLASACNFVTARILLKAGRQHDSITLEADAHHLMTDVWTSVGIGAGLLVVLWAPDLAWLDPLLAVGVAANILVTAFRLLRRSANGLMDAALPAAEVSEIETTVAATLAGRGHLRYLRTRKSGAQRFVEATLVLPDTMTVRDAHAICDVVEAAIQRGYARPPQVVLHVEPEAAQSPATDGADAS